jgi:histone H3/H4
MSFPKLPFERILKRNGAKRVADEAALEFALIMEEMMSKIIENAWELAKHAGRKTLLVNDVKLARRKTLS